MSMSITQDLSDLWNDRVARGLMVNQFTDPRGHRIEVGLRLEGGHPEYYARDLSAGVAIDAQVQERIIDGTNFRIQYNPYRGLKPRATLLGPGRQPEISPDPERCLFECMN